MSKVFQILQNAFPILLMMVLIPLIKNDYILTGFYIFIIIISLYIKKHRNDILVLFFGFFVMLISEYLFIYTGVETFNRNTLFGIMPLWLPFLWAYGFVAIKRGLEIIG